MWWISLIIPLVFLICLFPFLKKLFAHNFSKFNYKHTYYREGYLISQEIKDTFIKNCITASLNKENKYMYKRQIKNANENIRRKLRMDRGKKLERIIHEQLSKKLTHIPYLVIENQLKVGKKSICDFVLEWKDYLGKKRAIILECKHSDSSIGDWTEKQVETGIDQLHRYRKLSEKTFGWQVDLLVLFTDFPWDYSGPAELQDGVLILNLNSMFDIFIKEFIDWHNKTILPPVSLEMIEGFEINNADLN